VIAGVQSRRVLNAHEKQVIAYHSSFGISRVMAGL